jgi:protein-disulfide isomerase
MTPNNKLTMRILNYLIGFSGIIFLVSCKSNSTEMQAQVITNKVEQKEEDVLFGDYKAPKTIFLYASYDCDYCRYFFSRTYPDLKANFLDSGKLKLVVKWVDFDENQQMMFALQAASCIGRFGVYEKYHQLLLVNPEVVFTADFVKLVNDIMSDNSEIAECILNNTDYEYLHSNVKEFRDNNLTGTPTFIMNNHAYSGFISYNNFKKLIVKEFNL